MKSILSFICLFSCVARKSFAFTAAPGCRHVSKTALSARQRRRKFEEPASELPTKIPQLPAFGATSLGITTPESSSSPSNSFTTPNAAVKDTKDSVAFLSRKMEVSYTCNRCETRNSHLVSRQAYYQGVVIARCQGCKVQHLLADHLDFTSMYQGNIEDYFAQQGSTEQVRRVSREVYNLENILSIDTKSGSIRDIGGNVHLE